MYVEELGIEMLWSVGGGKVQSSSAMVVDSGMIAGGERDTELDGVDITPSSRRDSERR